MLELWPHVCCVKLIWITPDKKLVRFHAFDEMPCKIDSIENLRSFEKHPTPPQYVAGFVRNMIYFERISMRRRGRSLSRGYRRLRWSGGECKACYELLLLFLIIRVEPTPPPCSPSLWMVSVRTKRPMSKQTWVEQGWVWEREKDTLNPGWFGQRSWKSTQCDNMCICALQYSPKCQLGDTLCCNALSYVAAFLQYAPDNGSRFHWKKQLRNTAKKFQIHICRILTRIKLRCFFSLYFAPPPLLAPNLSWSYSDESNCVSASTSDGEEVVLHLQRVLVCILLLFVQRVLVYLVCTMFVPCLYHVCDMFLWMHQTAEKLPCICSGS